MIDPEHLPIENNLLRVPRSSIRQQVKQIHHISEILTAVGLKHWIDFGTLLGAVRDGGFIKTDVDFDFDFLSLDKIKLLSLKERLLKETNILLIDGPIIRGCPMHSSLRLENDIAAIESCSRNGLIYVDFCPCEISSKFVIHALEAFSFRTFFIDELQQSSFEGFYFPSPRHQAELLRHRYGEAWRRPLPLHEHRPIEYKCIIPFYRQVAAYCPGSFDEDNEVEWKVLKRARDLFDRVVVGIYTDEVLLNWGQRFVKDHKERAILVDRSGLADEVISHPPLTITEGFLDKNALDYVLTGTKLHQSFIGIEEIVLKERLHTVSVCE